MRRHSLFILAAALLVGCAARSVVDGIEVNESDWARARGDVLTRASFDLSCSKEELQVQLLKALGTGMGPMPQQIGVSGCEKKAVYVATVGGWVKND